MKTPQKDLDVKRDPSFPSNFPQNGITLPDEKHILGDGWHHQPSRVWLSPEPAPCQACTEALGPEGQAAVCVAKHAHTHTRATGVCGCHIRIFANIWMTRMIVKYPVQMEQSFCMKESCIYIYNNCIERARETCSIFELSLQIRGIFQQKSVPRENSNEPYHGLSTVYCIQARMAI